MGKYVFVLVVVALVAVVALPAAAAQVGSSHTQPEKAATAPSGPSAPSGCTATKNDCGQGCPPLTCTGANTCTVGSNYVECDGVRSYCPTHCGCDAIALCGPGPGGSIYCQGYSYCNSVDGCWVTCDGQTTYCPNAPAPPVCPYVY